MGVYFQRNVIRRKGIAIIFLGTLLNCCIPLNAQTKSTNSNECISAIGDVAKNNCTRSLSLNWRDSGGTHMQILSGGASAYIRGISTQAVIACDNQKGEKAYFNIYGTPTTCKS